MSKRSDKLAADAAVSRRPSRRRRLLPRLRPRAGEKADVTRVYCGPTVRGVAKQYTVFRGGIPEALEAFIAIHPEARALVVDGEALCRDEKRLETAGTAEAILYGKIKSEL